MDRRTRAFKEFHAAFRAYLDHPKVNEALRQKAPFDLALRESGLSEEDCARFRAARREKEDRDWYWSTMPIRKRQAAGAYLSALDSVNASGAAAGPVEVILDTLRGNLRTHQEQVLRQRIQGKLDQVTHDIDSLDALRGREPAAKEALQALLGVVGEPPKRWSGRRGEMVCDLRQWPGLGDVCQRIYDQLGPPVRRGDHKTRCRLIADLLNGYLALNDDLSVRVPLDEKAVVNRVQSVKKLRAQPDAGGPPKK